RAEVGRLRTELTEQLNGELLIERIIMRTQGFRRTGEHAAAADTMTPDGTTGGLGTGAPPWDDDLSRGLTAPPPAFRFDDPGPTREYETVRPVRSTAPAPSDPRTTTFSWSSPPHAAAEPAPTPLEWLADRSLVHPDDRGDSGPDRPSRHAA